MASIEAIRMALGAWHPKAQAVRAFHRVFFPLTWQTFDAEKVSKLRKMKTTTTTMTKLPISPSSPAAKTCPKTVSCLATTSSTPAIGAVKFTLFC